MTWNLLGELMPPAVDTAKENKVKSTKNSEDSGNCSESEGEFEVLDGKSQEIPANPCDTPPENLSLENAILANFPDGCDRSFTVELKDEDSFDIIPKSLTFAEITDILNQAIQEDNCEELDKVVQNIEDYEGRSITLDNVNLKSFCEQQLNLDLNRSDHQHIYSNVLSQYKFDQEEFKYDYSVKELVLLAIAANNKLAEKYQNILFTKENLSLLPLLIGGQKYIEAFIEKFHGTDGVYGRLKDQTIQLVEPNKIGFFSVIALRKEQELLNAVFVEYVLRDFGQVLKTSNPDSLYGVLETASLIKNEEFITIVLDAFERYINEPTKKASTEELLKKSFATLLETAISQERISVIEYLYKRYTNSADHAIYDVYEQAFADDKVITILKQQILKNIGARGRKEIYDLILKTALDAGNIAFIEHLCEKCAECVNDVINYLDHKSKNYESILIALSNVEGASTVINEPSFLSQVVNEKSDDQSENPGFESAGSQQSQRNILDNEKDIMNNEEASKEEPIGNDCDMIAKCFSALTQRPGNDKNSSKQPQENIVDRRENIMNNEELVVTTTRQPNDSEHDKTVFKEHQGDAAIQNTQPKTLVVDSKPSNTGVKSDEKKQAPVQPTEHVPEESAGLKAQPSNTQEQQEVPGTPVLGQMDDTESLSTQDDLVLQSGSLNPIAGMENTQNLQSAVLSSQQLASRNIIEIFNKHGREDFTPLTLKLTVQEFLNNGISEIQLPASNGCITFNFNVINKASPEELQNIVKVLTDLYKNGAPNDRTRNATGTGAQDDIDVYRLFSEEDPIPTPTPAPTPALKPTLIPSVANNKSEQVNDTQTNGKLPNNPGNGSITAAQNTQKTTVATWTFAVAGILAGAAAPAAYFAFSVSLLTTGIIAGVGACCLVAAAIIYYCTPKSQVENSEVEKPFNTREVPTAVPV